LETLSLERNNIVGDGIFSFLGVMPRLKNLNLSHNKITGFPESALFFEEKRGAAFHQLLYLNLAHNQLTEEENIFFTSELHSLQKLVLYGNPLAHGALIPFDKTKLAYDPVPHLTASFEQQERKVLIALAYPESRKRTSNSYENVEIYKMIPNEVQFKTPFRSRSNRFNITDYYKKEEVSSPLQEVVQKEMPKSAPTKCK
jgi:hypothetical protein